MIPYEVEYVRASSVQDALSLLSGDADAKILAGGHSLVPMMKLRLARPSFLVDIGRLAELRGIEVHPDRVSIGSATTHAELAVDSRLKTLAPLFALVGQVIADPAVRNRGTIGGSLVNADPASDWPAAVLALDAIMEVAGANGSRRVPVRDFFVGFMASAVRQDEILTRIHIPLPAAVRVGYRKFRHPSSGYAVAAAAVTLRFDGDKCLGGTIGITGVADMPFRAYAAEALLAEGFAGGVDEMARIAAAAFDGVAPLEDSFADAGYRLQLGRVMLKRALADACAGNQAGTTCSET
ncbi:aerobic carbon monoxide dehydrogenase [Cupriavidus basilensis OR16]|uniref:Aerobic carbon monoxide dehydrogenase n=1 Tax=Cupriavidus basilensis OR16 TaxID=1127483 RepID=H1RZE6_9BURK|nr:xanthine dehydrogenase family protein subunit M [Cupriavidus basilensis]EHP44288.1 aerobic carbon monoxide dehydrogenase [Cupriavidus basilensis OR16]